MVIVCHLAEVISWAGPLPIPALTPQPPLPILGEGETVISPPLELGEGSGVRAGPALRTAGAALRLDLGVFLARDGVALGAEVAEGAVAPGERFLEAVPARDGAE